MFYVSFFVCGVALSGAWSLGCDGEAVRGARIGGNVVMHTEPHQLLFFPPGTPLGLRIVEAFVSTRSFTGVGSWSCAVQTLVGYFGVFRDSSFGTAGIFLAWLRRSEIRESAERWCSQVANFGRCLCAMLDAMLEVLILY